MTSSAEEDDDSQDFSENKSRRQKKVNKTTFNSLNIGCEWLNCDKILPKANNLFYDHVYGHVKDPEVVGINEDNNEEIYKCCWSTCNFGTIDPKEFIRHVKYHGYHAELRALGSYVSNVFNLPPCTVTNEFTVLNYVDDFPLICSWDMCQKTLPGIQEFIEHVHCHVRGMPTKKKNKNSSYNCLWTDCNSTFPAKSKLTDHLKIHTKQHFIACPKCGHTFANKTKFVDHCCTQKPIEEHIYQCDYCLSYHPSERILRKHMGQHIHHYRCPFCNMTCNKPSLLAKHVRYRHLNYRSFACTQCDFKCKSKGDLQSHVFTHVKGIHACSEDDCNYITSSQLMMKRHTEMVHESVQQPRVFSCHICDKKFKKGAQLTKHLSSKHNMNKPPGYSRFLYRLESDGNRRLQSVRLESLEVNELDGYDSEISNMAGEATGTTTILQSDRELESGAAIMLDVVSDTGQIVSSSIVVPEASVPSEDVEIIAFGT